VSASPGPGERMAHGTRRAHGHRWPALLLPVLLGLTACAGLVGAGGPSAIAPPGAPIASAGNALEAAPPPSPPCYALTPTICVAMTNSTAASIIPSAGSFTASTEPPADQSIVLVVKSREALNSPNSPTAGPDALLQLNVTGTLWNGDPYYSVYSANVWHANNATTDWWCAPGTGCFASNGSYPYWYYVEFAASGGPGAGPNFAPGMHVVWWIAFHTTNGTAVRSWTSPEFSFTFAGAWPFSPYPGAIQYAGPGAVAQDVVASIRPAAPNWNDPVTATLSTTAADGPPVNATFGSAYWVVEESTPRGIPIATTTIAFSPAAAAGPGNGSSVSATLPSGWAQVSGARVAYWFVIYDGAGDSLRSPSANYTVGGNGSFATGIFGDDLSLRLTPSTVANETNAPVPLGGVVGVQLASRNASVALLAAEVRFSFSDPAIGETVNSTIPLLREFSTRFAGTLPALPLGAVASFTVVAWDFSERAESSPTYSYRAPTLSEAVPQIPGNGTFFFVYVYDNGSHDWVSNATVEIHGASNFLGIETSTIDGIAYPNVSGVPLVPVVLPANATYRISVLDPAWSAAAAPANRTVTIALPVGTSLGARGPVYVGPDATVLVEADAVLFYLNATPAPAPGSPAAPAATAELPGLVALLGGAVAIVPLVLWWRRVEARRASEREKVIR
jgi:hypothetical protein